MLSTRILALALVLVPLPGAPSAIGAGGQDALDAIRERGREVLDGLVERGVVGASAAIVLPDGRRVALASGFASLDEQADLRPEDRLLVGSVGKTYVTGTVHHLAQKGVLDLDRPAASWFEGQELEWLERLPNARRVTLRQLLRHQSGMPRYVFQPEFARDLMADADRVWEPEELLSYVFDHEPLFAPGEGWAYADTNYIVVGLVIEKATDRSFYEYVREHLLEPNDLKDTVPSDRRSLPGVVQGHVTAGRALGVPERTLVEGRFVFNPQFEWTGGGYASTPLDLARWASLLYGGEAFEGEYLDSLLDGVPAPALGPGMRYGLGAMLRDTPLGPFAGHDGFMPGYLTSMGLYREAGIAVAIQLNDDDGRKLGRPLSSVLDTLAGIAAAELADLSEAPALPVGDDR